MDRGKHHEMKMNLGRYEFNYRSVRPVPPRRSQRRVIRASLGKKIDDERGDYDAVLPHP